MATRDAPTPIDADSSSGSLPAARNDWRIHEADSMSARADTSAHEMPDRRLQAIPPAVKPIDQFLVLGGESMYESSATMLIAVRRAVKP